MNIFQVILKPVVSEKSVSGQGDGKWSFLVAQKASKDDVRKAVSEIYGVKVEGVNMLKQAGKVRKLKTGKGVRRQERKKAIVTLKKGEVLDPGKVFSEFKEEKKK